MKETLREVQVVSLGMDKASNTPVVVLREKDGDGILPIWIGPGEASAIAMKLAGVKFSRPLTHDLLSTVVQGLGSRLVRVVITKVVDNTYYASLIFRQQDELISVDSRPSDSIALALRSEAPIYADKGLLELTLMEIEESGLEAEAAPEDFFGGASEEGSGESEPSGEPSPRDLREYLEGLDPEDFGRFTP